MDEPLQMEAFAGSTGTAPEVYTYHTDHLGSVRALTDSVGNVSHAYDYDSYGNLVAEVEPVATPAAAANPFRFTGREWDAAVQLYHYRARGYDPDTGRFIQEDPIGFAAGDLNVYGYVWTNPLKFTDPGGLTAAEQGALNEKDSKVAGGAANLGYRLDCAFNSLAAIVSAAGGNFSIEKGVETADACGAKINIVGANGKFSKGIDLFLGPPRKKPGKPSKPLHKNNFEPPRLGITYSSMNRLLKKLGFKGTPFNKGEGFNWFLNGKHVFKTRKASSEGLPTLDRVTASGKKLDEFRLK